MPVSNPPKPRLVFHVGITGHRPPQLPDEAMPRVEVASKRIFTQIASSLNEVAGITQDQFSGETRLIRVISSLAEGADRVTAQSAMEIKAEIQCPLPFHRDEYEEDFNAMDSRADYRTLLDQASAVMELNGDRKDAEGAYLEAGRVMLEQSDILIAIWDGKPARGRGGTGEIVAEALAAGKLVLQIVTDQPGKIRVLGRPDSVQWDEAVREEFRRLILCEGEAAKSLNRYLSERESRINWGWLFTLFRNVVCQGRFSGGSLANVDYIARTRAQWAEDWQKHSQLPQQVEEQITRGFLEHYAWADHLAVGYAGLFRSACVLRYVLITAAIWFTAYGFYASSMNWIGFAGQVTLLSAVCALILVENKWQWHRRSLEYRLLAEQFRLQAFLYPLGRGVCGSGNGVRVKQCPAWIAAYIRSVVRQAGLVSTVINPRYVKEFRSHLVEAEIKPQINYQKSVAEWQDRLQRRLQHTAMFFFVLGVLAFGGRTLAYRMWPNTATGRHESSIVEPAYAKRLILLVKVGSIVFPALGVMFAGLRSQGEFKRLSVRAATTSRIYERTQANMAACIEGWEDSVRATSRLAEEMLGEVTDWRVVIEGKGLSLPI